MGTASFHGGAGVGEGRDAGIRIAQLPEIHWRGPDGNHGPEEVPETLVESWKWDFIEQVQFQVKKKNDLGQKSKSANSGGGEGLGSAG